MNYQKEHIPRPVKIGPMDKELYFDGINIPVKTFIRRYEAAGQIDGAEPVLRICLNKFNSLSKDQNSRIKWKE